MSTKALALMTWVGVWLTVGLTVGLALGAAIQPDGARDEPVACYVVPEPEP